MPTILSFKSIENNHDVYRGRGCMKKFSKSLKRTHNGDNKFKKKKKKLLTNEHQKSYENTKICYICN